MSTGTNVVTFGKHKGQPVEVLAADENYVQWLIQQPWFAERYQNLYNVVMHINPDVPQDSPVHNAVQMQLSGREYGAALAFLVGGVTHENFWGKDEHYTGHGGLRCGVEPEFEGWDLWMAVHYTSEGYTNKNINFYGVWMRLPLEDGNYHRSVRLPAGIDSAQIVGSLPHHKRDDYHKDYSGRCVGSLTEVWTQDEEAEGVKFTWTMKESEHFHGMEGDDAFRETWEPYLENCAHMPAKEGHEWTLVSFREDNRTGSTVTSRMLVEVKPELGDDYPSVLRQMVEQTKRLERSRQSHVLGLYPHRVLYTRRYTGTGATLDEVKWFFRSKGITVVTEEELEWYAAIDAPSFR